MATQSLYTYEGGDPVVGKRGSLSGTQPVRRSLRGSVSEVPSTYIDKEGEGRKSIRQRQSLLQIAEAENVVEKSVEKEMEKALHAGENHLTTANASFGDKIGRRVPDALGLDELQQRWANVVKQRNAQAAGIDQELDDLEAEIYGDIRDRRKWPKSAVDPRTQNGSWRDITWEPLTRGSGPPPAKDVAIGAKPWVPWADPAEEAAKPPLSLTSSLTHAGLSMAKPAPHISSKPSGPAPTAWSTVAEQWVTSLEKELANDLAVLEARREAERGGAQTLRRPP